MSAVEHMAFYTSIDRTESIGYEGVDLVVNVAFEHVDKGWRFVNEITKLNDLYAGLVVGVDLTPYYEALNYRSAIYGMHYSEGCYDSPPASFSDRFVALIAPASSGMATYQAIEAQECQNAVVFKKCHLKPMCECTPAEIDNPNNIICLTPNLLSMFDGTTERAPTLRIRAIDADSTPKDFQGEDGKVEKRYRVNLTVDFQYLMRAVELLRMVQKGFKRGNIRLLCTFSTPRSSWVSWS